MGHRTSASACVVRVNQPLSVRCFILVIPGFSIRACNSGILTFSNTPGVLDFGCQDSSAVWAVWTFGIHHNTQKDVYRLNTWIPVFSPPSSKSLTFYKIIIQWVWTGFTRKCLAQSELNLEAHCRVTVVCKSNMLIQCTSSQARGRVKPPFEPCERDPFSGVRHVCMKARL